MLFGLRGSAIIEVRCHCGQVFHADPNHAGRSIRCRCGKSVPIPTQKEHRSEEPVAEKKSGRSTKSRGKKRAGIGFGAANWSALRLPLARATWAYLAVVTLLCLFMWTEGDAWWPASVLLFGPRWFLLLPAILLLPLALLTRPRLAIPVLLAALVILGPIMGYRTGWRRWFAGTPARSLRVITFNAQGDANPNRAEVPAALLRFEADVIAIEECPSVLSQSSIWPADWTVRTSEDGLCMASRFPVLEARTLEQVRTGEQGGTGIATFFRLETGSRPTDIAIVHLETPRKGLESLRYAGRIARMQPSIMVRGIGTARIRRWIEQQSKDVIIAGDFNMPVESRIYRAGFGDCANAHSTAGHGFGWTRVLRWFSARIDHVVTCGGAWTALRTEVGPDLGSDHLPLIADLYHP